MKLGVWSKLLLVSLAIIALSAAVVEVDLTRSLDAESIQKLRKLVLVGTGFALLVAVFTWSVAAHFMSRSVNELILAARRMAEGDLDTRTGVAGEDATAELGRALDRLAGNLASALSDLRAERDLLSRVLHEMREGLLLLDRDRRVALANRALRDMLLLPSDLVGRSPLELMRNADLKRTLDEAQSSNEPVSREIELGDIKPRRLLVHAAALTGSPGGVLAVFVDVTDLRRLETMRRNFVANVSHELRTPITVVRSAAETAAQALRTQPEAAAEFIEVIERQAERLQQLVEDLLQLARIESPALKLSPESIAWEPFARHVLTFFGARARERDIELVLEGARDLPSLHADRRAVEQVLSNLLDNGVRYASTGATITVRAVREGDKLKTLVSDTGPGIEARHLPQLFERFYRVDAGRSRELGGTGLGLSIAKHLIEAMDGTLTVESAPGTGTTFAFTLPVAASIRTDVAVS